MPPFVKPIEALLRKVSWLPGMGWLDTWVNLMYSKAGAFGQTTGDLEVQAKNFKSLATDPLGQGAAASGGDAGGDTAADGSPQASPGKENAASDGVKSPAPKPIADGNTAATAPAGSNSNVPPQYRAQRSAMRASCLVWIFLFVLVAVVWGLFYFDPRNVPWRHSMSWWRIATQVILVFTIPFVLHRIIRLWLEGEQARFPDIDHAWTYGMQALDVTGVAIDAIPLYLMIGSENERQEMAIQAAANIEYRAAGAPAGPAALHWYITPHAIYLYASEVGWTSAIAHHALTAQTTGATSSSSVPSDAISSSMSPAGSGDFEGTIMADQWQGPGDSIEPAPAADRDAMTTGTLQLDQQETASIDRSQADESVTPTVVSSLSSGEAANSLERLRYLSRLIRNIRAPLCPLNGIVVLLPHRIMHAADQEMSEIEKAVSADLETIRTETQIMCPVTALVTGMENEAGFRELIRRVGIEKSVWQRFGKKFDVASISSETDVRGFSTHVVGAFEDWIYTLFREKESLTKPGNTSLYELLCSVRCSMKSRLERLLVRVFAGSDSSILFSGCYFAATGSRPDRQAFVRGVFDKLNEEQELLQWTREGEREDRRIRRFAFLGTLLSLAGVAAIVYLVGSRWFAWWP